VTVGDVWTDIDRLNQAAADRTGFPTQKPLALLERIVGASCPPGGTVLDCFLGSGTTAEAAEHIGRSWIGIDNSKYAIHLTRKRLIQLQGQPRTAKAEIEFVKCDQCSQYTRKERPQKTREIFNVRPFTLENMGVYQRAEQWQGFQTHRSEYRDEMVRVFGGVPVTVSPLLHGEMRQTWIHVGPLDSAVVVSQVWAVAREAAKTDRKSVTILAADFNTLSDEDS
jgi:adenine-specific DNA-methyltransferase